MVTQPKLVKILILSLAVIRCATADGQTQSLDLVAQAKKEGRVTWYTTVSILESKQFMDMFEKQYPLIKVDLLRSGSGEGLKKVFQDIENENMSESIWLFQQTFGLSAG